MVKCKKCGKNVHPLEVFPNNYCIDCHTKRFDAELKKTGILPKPDFVKAIRGYK